MPKYNDVILGEVVDLLLLHLINLSRKSNAAKVVLAFDSEGTMTPSSWDFKGSKNDLEFLCQEKSNFTLLAHLLNAAPNYPENIPINLFIVSNQFRSQDVAEKAEETQLLGLESIMLYLISENVEIPQPFILKFNCSNIANLEKNLRVDMGLPPISQTQDKPDPSCLKRTFSKPGSEQQNYQFPTNG
jgi:hypothetical protein